MYKDKLRTVAVAAIFAGLVGCSSNSEQTQVESNLNLNNAPDWVNIGTQTVENDEGRLLHGVGMAAVLADESLQKSVADNRALAEVARTLSNTISTLQNELLTSDEEQVNAQIKREITAKSQTALNGAKIIGRWKDPESGTVYSFAELDLGDLEAAIERAASLAVQSN